MTAMISATATTREERRNKSRNKWLEDAVAYLIKIGVYAPDELEGANELAEILWDSSDNEDYFDDHALFQSAEDAVDEELTYWGD